MALNNSCLSEWYPELRDAYDDYLRSLVGPNPDADNLSVVYHAKRNEIDDNSPFGWHMHCNTVRERARQITGIH
ncbi:hypothetical protein GCM10025776_36200 [Corallincola platygyrae]